jgi:oxygen-dependent protoporphyrinogen oxidase
MSLRQGLGQLIDALVDHLPGVALRLGTAVRYAVRGQHWHVALAEGPTLEADAVCVAVPAPAAATLLERQDRPLAAALGQIPYASVAVVNLVYDRAQIRHPLNGFGFVVPAVEERPLIGCAFSSVKFPGRAPEGQVLLRAFVGGALQPDAIELADAQLLTGVLTSLEELLGVRGQPRAAAVHRLRASMPQYHLGHRARVAAIEALAAAHPGLQLTGNAYDGVGLPDCLRRAHQAAEALIGEPR